MKDHRDDRVLRIVTVICIAMVACAACVWMGLSSRFWGDSACAAPLGQGDEETEA